jgi:hypothetical protein
MTWGIPNWAWVIIFLQVIALYWIQRLARQAYANYARIMRQLGANVPLPKELQLPGKEE